ncbi:TPA: AmmeMemoRadiSam system protein B [Candidatus Micrarchaeota archaeon]|nr:AmmeMemoRadiSam system protein B [Candidatus Micrarchaeota archaeon]
MSQKGGTMEEGTRPASVAGTFYPAEPDRLRAMIEEFLGNAKGKAEGTPRGMVVPHAGYIYSGQVAAYGYRQLQEIGKGIERIILVGPSHYSAFFGAAESGMGFWQTPLGIVKAGTVRDKVENKELISVAPEIHAPEHCLEVQVPFLQVIMEDFTIYPLLTGDVVPEVLAEALLPLMDEKTFFIASSDLSHYHPYEKAVKLDSIANDAVPNFAFEKLKGAEACGMTGMRTLMHVAKKSKWKGKMLEYRNSGDTAGDKSQVVGYGCYMFYE